MVISLGKDRIQIIESLKKSFDPSKGVPTDLDDYQKAPAEYFQYYSSTLSTYLLAFHKLDLLTLEERKKLQDSLLLLRDSTFHQIKKPQKQNDRWAWSISEGACVFATSWAIWALLETDYQGDKLIEIKNAVSWLCNQQRKDGGFGFDISCESKIFFTSLSLHALRVSKIKISYTDEEKNQIDRCIKSGIAFILEGIVEHDDNIHWKSNIEDDDPDATSTLYALWALFEEDKEKYKEFIQKGITYLRNSLVDKPIWDIKPILNESSKIYGTQKIIVTFTPSFPIILLKLGVRPLDELCMKPIIWLNNNKTKNGWPLKGYGSGAVSFITVLGLWTIDNWEKSIIEKTVEKNIKMEKNVYVDYQTSKIHGLEVRVLLFFTLMVILIIIIARDYIFLIFEPLKAIFSNFIAVLSGLVILSGFFGVAFNIKTIKNFDNKHLRGTISTIVQKTSMLAKRILFGFK